MMRTQIQLPNDLYQRVKRYGATREMSLAEVTRRSLELFLDRYPSESGRNPKDWKLPKFKGGMKVRPEKLRDLLDADRERHAARGVSR